MGRAIFSFLISFFLASAVMATEGRAEDVSDASVTTGDPTVAEVQNALIWTGAYDGMVDGRAGSRTTEAIRTFQRLIGSADTGGLTVEEWAKLSAVASDAQERFGWSRYEDANLHWSVSYPAKILTEHELDDSNHAIFHSVDDVYRLEVTVTAPKTPEDVDTAFRQETNTADGREVIYSREAESWYVVRGTRAGQDFYLKAFHLANSEFVLRFSWPTNARNGANPMAIAMVNSIGTPGDLSPKLQVSAEDVPETKAKSFTQEQQEEQDAQFAASGQNSVPTSTQDSGSQNVETQQSADAPSDTQINEPRVILAAVAGFFVIAFSIAFGIRNKGHKREKVQAANLRSNATTTVSPPVNIVQKSQQTKDVATKTSAQGASSNDLGVSISDQIVSNGKSTIKISDISAVSIGGVNPFQRIMFLVLLLIMLGGALSEIGQPLLLIVSLILAYICFRMVTTTRKMLVVTVKGEDIALATSTDEKALLALKGRIESHLLRDNPRAPNGFPGASTDQLAKSLNESEPSRAPKGSTPTDREAQGRSRTAEEIKTDVIERRQAGQPGLMTEWISNQTQFPTPDHVPVEYAVDMIFQLYGGFEGLRLLVLEGFTNYLAEDVLKAFGYRGERILEVWKERIMRRGD